MSSIVDPPIVNHFVVPKNAPIPTDQNAIDYFVCVFCGNYESGCRSIGFNSDAGYRLKSVEIYLFRLSGG
jgi:hypothetical protein